jgi:hypothetical protein
MKNLLVLVSAWLLLSSVSAADALSDDQQLSARSLNTTDKKASDVELANALAREAQLKKELEDAQTMLSKAVVPPKAFPVQATTPDPAVLAEQQRIAASKIFGPNGIMNILNPKIMDQNDAAQKLIPALNIPQVNGLQQQRPQASGFGQQPQQFQSAFPQQPVNYGQGLGQQGYPQQLPQVGYPSQGTGFLPQQGLAQPAYGSPFGSAMNPGGLGSLGSFAQPQQMMSQFPQQNFGR